MFVCAMNEIVFQSWTACGSPYTMQTDRLVEKWRGACICVWETISHFEMMKKQQLKYEADKPTIWCVNRLHIVKLQVNSFFPFLFVSISLTDAMIMIVFHQFYLSWRRVKENKRQSRGECAEETIKRKSWNKNKQPKKNITATTLW